MGPNTHVEEEGRDPDLFTKTYCHRQRDRRGGSYKDSGQRKKKRENEIKKDESVHLLFTFLRPLSFGN